MSFHYPLFHSVRTLFAAKYVSREICHRIFGAPSGTNRTCPLIRTSCPKSTARGKEGHPHDTVRVELLFATTKYTEGCRELNIIIVIITGLSPWTAVPARVCPQMRNNFMRGCGGEFCINNILLALDTHPPWL